MTTLHSVVLSLTAAKTATLPQTHGHFLRGAFYELLRTVDAETASDLHNANQRKPFTVSTLRGVRSNNRTHRIHLRAGDKAWIRLTMFDDWIHQNFLTSFIQGITQLRIGSAQFDLKEIITAHRFHRMADCITTTQLSQHWQAATIGTQEYNLDLRFHSPTAFALSNHPHRGMGVLPDPVLVFGELAAYWDALTGEETAEGVGAFSAENIVIAAHEIKTVALRFPDAPQIGFKGFVSYKILGQHHPKIIQHINCLADLAFFTGIGYKTPLGMGQLSRA